MIVKLMEIYNECYKMNNGLYLKIEHAPCNDWSIYIAGGYEVVYNRCGKDFNKVAKEAILSLLEYAKAKNIDITTRLDV